MWQSNACHKIWKLHKIFQNWGYGSTFLLNVFVVNGIDIDQLNLRPFKILELIFFVCKSIQKTCFLTFD